MNRGEEDGRSSLSSLLTKNVIDANTNFGLKGWQIFKQVMVITKMTLPKTQHFFWIAGFGRLLLGFKGW